MNIFKYNLVSLKKCFAKNKIYPEIITSEQMINEEHDMMCATTTKKLAHYNEERAEEVVQTPLQSNIPENIAASDCEILPFYKRSLFKRNNRVAPEQQKIDAALAQECSAHFKKKVTKTSNLQCSEETIEDVLGMAETGDFFLIRERGLKASFFRTITRSRWNHVAVVATCPNQFSDETYNKSVSKP
jgi:hypothetical protein